MKIDNINLEMAKDELYKKAISERVTGRKLTPVEDVERFFDCFNMEENSDINVCWFDWYNHDIYYHFCIGNKHYCITTEIEDIYPSSEICLATCIKAEHALRKYIENADSTEIDNLYLDNEEEN